MTFESRDLLQRRARAPTFSSVAVKNATGSTYAYVNRRRKGLRSSPVRISSVAMVLSASVLIALALLTSQYLHRGGSVNKSSTTEDAIHQMGHSVKSWKPRSNRRKGRGWFGAEERNSKTTSIDKESERAAIDNNDEQGSSIRRAKAKKKSIDKSTYRPKFDQSVLGYDIHNCPSTPPSNYPQTWKATEVLKNWNPNDATTVQPAHRDVYHGLCIFDFQTQYDTAKAYRDEEKPFIIRNDPNVVAASRRWKDPEYLLENLPDVDEKLYTERSPINHFMFWRKKDDYDGYWIQPRNDDIEMSYKEWLEHALEREGSILGSAEMSDWARKLREARLDAAGDDDDEDTEEEKRLKWYYLRLNGWLDDADEEGTDKFVFDELKFFDPRREDSEFYLLEPEEQRGINCRFGMRGLVAENHLDLSRNMLALLEGERRYVIAHPAQCSKMALFPKGHPSGRHSSFDWSNPADWDLHPEFKEARVSEVVMQAGDVLFLPTAWFHYIVNLSKNIQCNIRSGIGQENMGAVRDCGFVPSHES